MRLSLLFSFPYLLIVLSLYGCGPAPEPLPQADVLPLYDHFVKIELYLPEDLNTPNASQVIYELSYNADRDFLFGTSESHDTITTPEGMVFKEIVLIAGRFKFSTEALTSLLSSLEDDADEAAQASSYCFRIRWLDLIEEASSFYVRCWRREAEPSDITTLFKYLDASYQQGTPISPEAQTLWDKYTWKTPSAWIR